MKKKLVSEGSGINLGNLDSAIIDGVSNALENTKEFLLMKELGVQPDV